MKIQNTICKLFLFVSLLCKLSALECLNIAKVL